VTGAPLEHLGFEDVTYWRDLVRICKWAASNVGGTLYICWASFAAHYTFLGARTRILPHKLAGVFQQQVMETTDPLMSGLGFSCPVSRHGEVGVNDVPWRRGLTCLVYSPESGLCLVSDTPRNAHYMFNNLEYDADVVAAGARTGYMGAKLLGASRSI
jgi:homoserine O-succinyltransferase/O-acetyltransferase